MKRYCFVVDMHGDPVPVEDAEGGLVYHADVAPLVEALRKIAEAGDPSVDYSIWMVAVAMKALSTIGPEAKP